MNWTAKIPAAIRRSIRCFLKENLCEHQGCRQEKKNKLVASINPKAGNQIE